MEVWGCLAVKWIGGVVVLWTCGIGSGVVLWTCRVVWLLRLLVVLLGYGIVELLPVVVVD